MTRLGDGGCTCAGRASDRPGRELGRHLQQGQGGPAQLLTRARSRPRRWSASSQRPAGCWLRARGGNASPRRKLASFIDECVTSIRAEAWPRYELWIRIDWAGLSNKVVETCCAHKAIFTITGEQNAPGA